MIRTIAIAIAGAFAAAAIGVAAPAQAAPFPNCKTAKANGVCDITEDSPYWSDSQDRDDDGIACEC